MAPGHRVLLKSEWCWAVRGWLVFMGWVISYANEWEEYSNFQELGHHLLFGLLQLALELSWHLWVCHLAYANVLQ